MAIRLYGPIGRNSSFRSATCQVQLFANAKCYGTATFSTQSKVWESANAAVKDVQSGSTLLVGGMEVPQVPYCNPAKCLYYQDLGSPVSLVLSCLIPSAFSLN